LSSCCLFFCFSLFCSFNSNFESNLSSIFMIWRNWLNFESRVDVAARSFLHHTRWNYMNSSKQFNFFATRSIRCINARMLNDFFHWMIIFTSRIFMSSFMTFVTQRIRIIKSFFMKFS
jgi:hypothetical protein